MKTILVATFILFFILNVFSTAQRPDKLIYNGIEYNLFSNPLETYFAKNPNKRPKLDIGGVTIQSSNLWRGYIATFELKDSILYVKDIQIEYLDSVNQINPKWKSVMAEVFPERHEVMAEWLNEILVLPVGKLINYVHMGYGSTYEKYILLEINQGYLKRGKNFDYKEYENFKEKQFKSFKKTKEYKMIKKDLKKDGNSQKHTDYFIRNYIIKYTSKILIE